MTTGDVLARAGIDRQTMKDWRKRGHLTRAPRGRRGAGRGNELEWEPEAVAEIVGVAKCRKRSSA